MLLVAFFSWWYGRGWQDLFQRFGPRLQTVSESFSVRQLTRTLFAPWRRIVTQPGRSLDEKWRAAVDNAFSRVIGFVVRCFVLLGASFTLGLVAVFTLIEILAWPLLPLAVPGLIIAGLSL